LIFDEDRCAATSPLLNGPSPIQPVGRRRPQGVAELGAEEAVVADPVGAGVG